MEQDQQDRIRHQLAPHTDDREASPPHPIHDLQQQIGNQAVSRLVQRDNSDRDDKRDDPLFGQNKAIDPKDKGAGLSGTWDFNSPPKITGGSVDVPPVAGVDPNGDPLKYDSNDPTKSGGPSGPTTPAPNHPGPPGSTWDPILGGWRKDGSPGDNSDLKPGPVPEPPKGDFPLPDGDEAVA